MATKHETKRIRSIIGALDFSGVDVPEIHERLKADQAGVGYALDISRRSVYYHRSAYRLEHELEAARDKPTESIEAQKLATIALAAREVKALERRSPGTMKAGEVSTLTALYKALCMMDRNERTQQNGGDPKPRRDKGTSQAKPSENALERLAREERESAGPLISDQESREAATSSGERSERLGTTLHVKWAGHNGGAEDAESRHDSGMEHQGNGGSIVEARARALRDASSAQRDAQSA